MEFGAVIERGRVRSVAATGYEVASLDRCGIVSPPILSIDGKEYAVGDMVYFFLFSDGTGKIICGAEP